MPWQTQLLSRAPSSSERSTDILYNPLKDVRGTRNQGLRSLRIEVKGIRMAEEMPECQESL